LEKGHAATPNSSEPRRNAATEKILVDGKDVDPEEECQRYDQPLAAYALALPRRVGDELLDQFFFRQAGSAAKLYETLLRFSQRSPKLLRITLLPDRDVEPEYPPVPAHGQRLVSRKIAGRMVSELPYAHILHAPPSVLLVTNSCDHIVPQILVGMVPNGADGTH
jgi:hypothetical protein